MGLISACSAPSECGCATGMTRPLADCTSLRLIPVSVKKNAPVDNTREDELSEHQIGWRIGLLLLDCIARACTKGVCLLTDTGSTAFEKPGRRRCGLLNRRFARGGNLHREVSGYYVKVVIFEVIIVIVVPNLSQMSQTLFSESTQTSALVTTNPAATTCIQYWVQRNVNKQQGGMCKKHVHTSTRRSVREIGRNLCRRHDQAMPRGE